MPFHEPMKSSAAFGQFRGRFRNLVDWQQDGVARVSLRLPMRAGRLERWGTTPAQRTRAAFLPKPLAVIGFPVLRER